MILRRLIWGTAALSLAVLPVVADVAPVRRIGVETPLLSIPTLSRVPMLDGEVEAKEWAEAGVVSSFRHFQSGDAAAHGSIARIGIDAEAVYVAFECAEVEMSRLAAGRLASDSMALFSRDHVELFLMPDVLGPVFYHFSVDASGNRHDECGNDPSWNGDWQAAVWRGQTGWSVEMRIARSSIGMNDTRMALGNFCRTRRIEPGETSAWSPTFGPFHNPAWFGRFVFAQAGGTRLSPLDLSQPVIGTNQIQVKVAEAPAETSIKGYAVEDGKARCFATCKGLDGTLELRVERDAQIDIVVAVEHHGEVLDFRPAMGVSLSGTRARPIRQVLAPEVTPAVQWIDRERLRGISYAAFVSHGMPEDGLERGDAFTPPLSLHLRGQSYFRIRAGAGEIIRFELTAETGECVFTQGVYAVFDPDGRWIGKGLVEAGEQREVTVPAEKEGTYVLLINSGPAIWNPFRIVLHNRYWVLDARGRSEYIGSPVALHSLRDCRLAGCNLSLMAAWNWGIPFRTDEGLAQWRGKLVDLCEAARLADIRIIPYLGWGCSSQDCDSVPEYTRALTRVSVRGPQPCPASREYWEGSFLRRALVVAELSKTNPAVAGVGLDPESYYFASWYKKHLSDEAERRKIWGVIMPIGGSPEKCICNECLHGLCEAEGLADPGLPEDGNVRFDWITKQGLIDELCAYQQARLEEILSDLRNRIQAVNPDFCFAVMHLSTGDDWFRRAMARGLGTPRVPVLDFDEGTYTSGYSERVVGEKLERYRGWQANVVHGGTLWMLKHPPTSPHFLAAQLFNFALYGHSYWVWPGSMSLWRSADRVRDYYSLSGYAEDYWASIALANREIDRRLAAPEVYRSDLEKIDTRPKIPVEPKGRNEWAEKPCYPVHMYTGTRLSFQVSEGTKQVRVLWGFRRELGEQTLVVSLAGKTYETTAEVKAEQPNVLTLDTPGEGGSGWVELRSGDAAMCIGIRIEGAKPFFGAGESMSLR